MSNPSKKTPSPPTSASRATTGHGLYFDSPPTNTVHRPKQSTQSHGQQIRDGIDGDRPSKRNKPQPSETSKRRTASGTSTASHNTSSLSPAYPGAMQPSSIASLHPPTDFPPRPYGPGEGPPPKAKGKIKGSEMDFLPFLEQRVDNVDRGIQKYYQMRAEKAKENADVFYLEEQNKKGSKSGSSSAF